MEQKGKRRKGTKGFTRLFYIGAAIILLYFAYFSYVQTKELRQLQQQKTQLSAELKRLKQENSSLREEKTRLLTDEYIEDLARKQLGLIKPGETVYIPVTENSNSENP